MIIDIKNTKHVKTLKGKVFKIMPLFQEENDGLTTYIGSLLYELEGLLHRLTDKEESMMITVISIIEHFYDDSISPDPDLETIRREVLGCVNLIDTIYKKGDS